MRRSLVRIWNIAVYNSMPVFRNPLTFLTIVVWPTVPIFFLGVFMGSEGVKQGVIGMMVTSISFSGIYVAQDYVFNRTISKLQDFLVASPVRQLEYIFGISLGSMFFSIPSTLLGFTFLIYLGLGNLLNILMVITLLLFGAFILLPLGFVIGSRYDDAGRVNGITNILAIVFSFFAPVYYALDYIPPEYRFYTYIIPTTHIAHLVRVVLGITDVVGFGYINHIIVLLLFALLFYGLSLRYSRWREV